MNIAENLLRIKAIVRELEALMATANPINRDCLFEPYVRLHIESSQGVIEADRIGNHKPKDAEELVNKWFPDKKWEKGI